MKKLVYFLVLISLQGCAQSPNESDYEWFRNDKFGVFIHWNPSSLIELRAGSWNREKVDKSHSTNKTIFDKDRLPEDIKSGEYLTKYKRRSGIPLDIYDNLFHEFNPKKFDADEWAKIFKEAGARYIVFTSKHHDGFCMFDSKYTEYDIMNTPYGKDIAKEVSDACAKQGIKTIWYYSDVDWHNPIHNLETQKGYEDYFVNQIDELSSNYKNIKGFWFDGGVLKEVNGERIFEKIHENIPGAIYNGRGPHTKKKRLRFSTPEQKTGAFDRKRPWESCAIIQGEGWFFNGGLNIKSPDTCLRLLIDSVIGDGNLLLDFGPNSDGEIIPEVQNVFRRIGAWLKENGQSIYGTRGGPYMPAQWGGSTCKGDEIYLHITQRWEGGEFELEKLPVAIKEATLLASGKKIKFRESANKVVFTIDKEDVKGVNTIVKLKIDGDAFSITPIKSKKLKLISATATATASSEIPGKRGSANSVIKRDFEKYVSKELFFGEKASKATHALSFPNGLTKEKLLKLVNDNPVSKSHYGHVWRYWTSKNEEQPWLELELEKEQEIHRITFREKYSRIKEFSVEYFSNGKWVNLINGNELAACSYLLSRPVKTKKVRINILKFHSDEKGGGPSIHGFELY